MVTWLYISIMIAAITSCSLLLPRFQAKLPLSRTDKLVLAVAGFSGAMLGAKLPFVFTGEDSWLTGLSWMSNGKTIMFGIVGGYASVECVKRIRGIRVRTGDTFAFPVALSVAIGRMACFSAGCCFGTETDLPWGVRFGSAADPPGVMRHPTQIYEAIFHGLAAILLLWAFQRLHAPQRTSYNRWDLVFHGNLLKAYLCVYMLFRFFTEFIRPEPRVWELLTFYQIAASIILPLFAGLWAHDVWQRVMLNRGPAESGDSSPH